MKDGFNECHIVLFHVPFTVRLLLWSCLDVLPSLIHVFPLSSAPSHLTQQQQRNVVELSVYFPILFLQSRNRPRLQPCESFSIVARNIEPSFCNSAQEINFDTVFLSLCYFLQNVIVCH